MVARSPPVVKTWRMKSRARLSGTGKATFDRRMSANGIACAFSVPDVVAMSIPYRVNMTFNGPAKADRALSTGRSRQSRHRRGSRGSTGVHGSGR